MLRERLISLRTLALVLIPVLIILILALVAGLYLVLSSPGSAVTIPEVEILALPTGDQVGEGAIVFVPANSNDPDGIAQAELWVNGELISSQVNPDSDNPGSFPSSHVWRPLDPGIYSLSVRAYDNEGYAGESDTLTLEALAVDPDADDENVSAYLVQEGDSFASLAERFETDREQLTALNPELSEEPQPGSTVYVPQPSEPEDDDDDSVAGVSAPGPSSPSPAGPNQAQPASAPPGLGIVGSRGLGSLLNNGASGLCARFPTVCNLPRAGESPPAPPTAVRAESDEACQVEISWTDESEDENGFQIIRVNAANRDIERTVARLRASQGTGQELSHELEMGLGGAFIFYVQAHNAAGTAASAPTPAVLVECDQVPGDAFPVEIEILELNVAQDVELMHCFVAVGNQPYVRVPSTKSGMMVRGGAADIASYLGGDKSLQLLVDPAQDVEVKADCIEHQRPQSAGGLLQGPPAAVSLGRFSNSHPADEWDGRTLTGESSLGQYTMAYRIQAQGYQALNGTPYSGDFLAAPQITGRTDSWVECWMPLTCQSHPDPGFSWDWDPPDDRTGEEEHIVYLWGKEGTQEEPTLIYQSERLPVEYWQRHRLGRWPTDAEICARFPVSGTTPEGARYHTIHYFMQIEYFTHWGASVLTPPSAPTGVAHFCEEDPVAYEVTLLDITAHEIQDFSWFAGTPEGEMYGSLYFGYEIHWNTHPIGVEPDLVVAPPPSTQALIPGTYSWENMFLQIEDKAGLSNAISNWSPPSEFALGNNVFFVPHFENRREDVFFFEDHDDGSGDDIWCVGFYPWAEGSPEEWLDTNETITIEGAEGNCSITVHLRGLRVGGAEE